MVSRFIKLALFAVLTACAAGVVYSQPPEVPDPPDTRRRPRSLNGSDHQAAMMAKLRSERDKKDHQEMLDRGEQALRLANQLEAAFAQNKNLSPQDRARLESLEDVVEKIRKELGGNDDGDDEDLNYQKPTAADDKPSNMEDAFKFLRSTTVKLVDELKKTTRFSISAVAIQSSNSVLKIVKFLRLRK
jgi:hypothetical protein